MFLRQSKNLSATRLLLEFRNKRWKLMHAWNELPKRILKAWNERDKVVIDASVLHWRRRLRACVAPMAVCVQNLATFTANYLGYACLNCDSYLTL